MSPEGFRKELPQLVRQSEKVIRTMMAFEQEDALSDKGPPGMLVLTDKRLLFYRAKRTTFRNKPKTFDSQEPPTLDRRLVGDRVGFELRLPALVDRSSVFVYEPSEWENPQGMQWYSYLETEEAGDMFVASFDKALEDQQSGIEKPLLDFMVKSVKDPERILMHTFADDGGVLLTNQRLLHFTLDGSKGDAPALRDAWNLSDPLAVRHSEERPNQIVVSGTTLFLHGTVSQIQTLYDLLLKMRRVPLQGATPSVQVVKETVHEVVKIPCRYCGVLNLNTNTHCSSCGAPVR